MKGYNWDVRQVYGMSCKECDAVRSHFIVQLSPLPQSVKHKRNVTWDEVELILWIWRQSKWMTNEGWKIYWFIEDGYWTVSSWIKSEKWRCITVDIAMSLPSRCASLVTRGISGGRLSTCTAKTLAHVAYTKSIVHMKLSTLFRYLTRGWSWEQKSLSESKLYTEKVPCHKREVFVSGGLVEVKWLAAISDFPCVRHELTVTSTKETFDFCPNFNFSNQFLQKSARYGAINMLSVFFTPSCSSTRLLKLTHETFMCIKYYGIQGHNQSQFFVLFLAAKFA